MTPLEEFAKEYLNRNPKMTALEIFAKEMTHLGFPIPQGRYEKCMEIEKQQIIKAVDKGFDEGCNFPEDRTINNGEQYYNETFKK